MSKKFIIFYQVNSRWISTKVSGENFEKYLPVYRKHFLKFKMMGLFKKAKTAPSPSDTIKNLRSVMESLEKRESYLEKKTNDEKEKALKLSSSNRKGISLIKRSFFLTLIKEALMALKRKKLYEGQIDRLNAARSKLDTQIIALENASSNLVILDAMQTGAEMLKQINRKMYVVEFNLKKLN